MAVQENEAPRVYESLPHSSVNLWISVDLYTEKATQRFGMKIKGKNGNAKRRQSRGNEKMELAVPLNIPLQKASGRLQLLTNLATF
jgi:hypothetical protein